MSSKRRKTRNNKFYADMPSAKSHSNQYKQIPSLDPTRGNLPVTNNKFAKKVARLLAALLIMVIIIFFVIGLSTLS